MLLVDLFVTQDAQPSDDRVEGCAHLVAESGQEHVFGTVGRFGVPPRCVFVGQQHLALALDLIRITANGVGQRLVNRLVEPGQVIHVEQVGGRIACASQPEHARPQGAVFRDHGPEIEA